MSNKFKYHVSIKLFWLVYLHLSPRLDAFWPCIWLASIIFKRALFYNGIFIDAEHVKARRRRRRHVHSPCSEEAMAVVALVPLIIPFIFIFPPLDVVAADGGVSPLLSIKRAVCSLP